MFGSRGDRTEQRRATKRREAEPFSALGSHFRARGRIAQSGSRWPAPCSRSVEARRAKPAPYVTPRAGNMARSRGRSGGVVGRIIHVGRRAQAGTVNSKVGMPRADRRCRSATAVSLGNAVRCGTGHGGGAVLYLADRQHGSPRSGMLGVGQKLQIDPRDNDITDNKNYPLYYPFTDPFALC
jgi:hypothetical protein